MCYKFFDMNFPFMQQLLERCMICPENRLQQGPAHEREDEQGKQVGKQLPGVDLLYLSCMCFPLYRAHKAIKGVVCIFIQVFADKPVGVFVQLIQHKLW